MTEPGTGRRPHPAGDDALLDKLAAALRQRPLAPPPERVIAVRRAVDQKWRPSGGARVIGQLASWVRRLQRTGAVVIALAGVAVGGSGVALAAKGSTPRPAQYTLHGLRGEPRHAALMVRVVTPACTPPAPHWAYTEKGPASTPARWGTG